VRCRIRYLCCDRETRFWSAQNCTLSSRRGRPAEREPLIDVKSETASPECSPALRAAKRYSDFSLINLN
jgi:hypothetical protein